MYMYTKMQMNTHKYGHDETRHRKLIKRRNDLRNDGSSAVLNIDFEKGRGKNGKKNYHTGDSYLVAHPSTNPAEQGLTSFSGRNMFLVV